MSIPSSTSAYSSTSSYSPTSASLPTTTPLPTAHPFSPRSASDGLLFPKIDIFAGTKESNQGDSSLAAAPSPPTLEEQISLIERQINDAREIHDQAFNALNAMLEDDFNFYAELGGNKELDDETRELIESTMMQNQKQTVEGFRAEIENLEEKVLNLRLLQLEANSSDAVVDKGVVIEKLKQLNALITKQWNKELPAEEIGRGHAKCSELGEGLERVNREISQIRKRREAEGAAAPKGKGAASSQTEESETRLNLLLDLRQEMINERQQLMDWVNEMSSKQNVIFPYMQRSLYQELPPADAVPARWVRMLDCSQKLQAELSALEEADKALRWQRGLPPGIAMPSGAPSSPTAKKSPTGRPTVVIPD